MSRALVTLGLLLALFGIPVPAGAASLSPEIDTLFTNYTKGVFPGAAVAVVQNGRLIHQRTYGYADLRTKRLITSETAFDLASVSKQFTAMGIMLLAERKQLSYDDPLPKHLPEFTGLGDAITLRHLLNHTSGLPEYEPLFKQSGLIDTNYPRQLQLRAGYEPTSKDVLTLLTKQKKLRFTPGERWEYSDSGYVVLAQVIERVTGQRYARYLHDKVFRPLGMTGAAVLDDTTPVIKNRATSYQRDGEWLLPIDYTPLNLIYGDGNVNATLADMIKWDRAIRAQKLVSKAAWNEAFTPGVLNNGSHTQYGFGWMLGELEGAFSVHHAGAWVGFRSYIQHCPERGISIIILSNFAGTKPKELGAQIAKLALGN